MKTVQMFFEDCVALSETKNLIKLDLMCQGACFSFLLFLAK